jgi:hypothetical protein
MDCQPALRPEECDAEATLPLHLTAGLMGKVPHRHECHLPLLRLEQMTRPVVDHDRSLTALEELGMGQGSLASWRCASRSVEPS